MDFFEIMLQQKLAGEGGDIKVNSFSITENGTYTALPGHAFSPVNVSVPVGVFPSGTSSITSNGIYNIADFASVDVNVSDGDGGHDVEDGIITRSISGTYTNSRVTSVENAAFQDCSALTTVNFPNVSYIGIYAFESCYSLTTISFPNASYIGNAAFQYCSALTTASFPNTSYIGSYAFQSCSALTAISFPNTSYIGSYAFQSCFALTAVSFPNVTNIGSGAFYSCLSLTTVNFPNVTLIGSNAFYYCSRLTTVSFPNVTVIGGSAFYSCSRLASMYFLATSVAKLSNANAFYNTPMSNSTYTGSFGSIYVPASLVDSYRTAAKWSEYADRITSYEGE